MQPKAQKSLAQWVFRYIEATFLFVDQASFNPKESDLWLRAFWFHETGKSDEFLRTVPHLVGLLCGRT